MTLRLQGIAGRLPRLLAMLVLTLSIGVVTAPAASATPSVSAPTVCTTDHSGYYCFYAGTNRGSTNGQWVEDNCFGNGIKAMPTYMRDEVRSWDHRQTGGAWMEGLNYEGAGSYGLVFAMLGQKHRSNEPDRGPEGADSIRNNC